jgi:hypothetical protein
MKKEFIQVSIVMVKHLGKLGWVGVKELVSEKQLENLFYLLGTHFIKIHSDK